MVELIWADLASVVRATERMVSSEKAGRFMSVLLHLIATVNRVR